MSSVNKKAGAAIQILIMLILIVITSGIVLLLVQSGFISVKADANQEPVLNTEFIPMGREGYLVLKDFKFCGFVDDKFNCINEKKEFSRGENVYVMFVVESSTFNGEVMLTGSYKIKNEGGELVLELEDKKKHNVELGSNEEIEQFVLTNSFIFNEGDPLGEYTVNVVVENPLLVKKVTGSKKVMLK